MAHVFVQDLMELAPHIRAEIEFSETLSQGSLGADVRRVQEWLNLHDLRVVVDEDFGSWNTPERMRLGVRVK